MKKKKESVFSEYYLKKAMILPLIDFCILSDEHDYIEVTNWENGEGFDVDIYGKTSEKFQLTYGQYKALKKLVKLLRK
jgi:hypothetical protein